MSISLLILLVSLARMLTLFGESGKPVCISRLTPLEPASLSLHSPTVFLRARNLANSDGLFVRLLSLSSWVVPRPIALLPPIAPPNDPKALGIEALVFAVRTLLALPLLPSLPLLGGGTCALFSEGSGAGASAGAGVDALDSRLAVLTFDLKNFLSPPPDSSTSSSESGSQTLLGEKSRSALLPSGGSLLITSFSAS